VDCVLHSRAGAADTETAPRLADRHNPEVDVRAEAGIEDDLLAAVVATPGEGREIQEAEIDRLLDLVDVLAGEEDVRDVGLPQLDTIDRVGISIWPEEGAD
jgi:hypothetical protein